MERLKELEEFIREYWTEHMKVKKNFINYNYEKMKAEFQEKLIYLIDHQKKQKREDIQERVQSIYLYRLMSSAYTESYDSIIGLSSSKLYLDENKTQIYWAPELMHKNICEDMKEVEIRLRKEFIRLNEYELLWVNRTLLNDDWILLQECFLQLVKDSIKLITEGTLQLESELQVMAGNYMDKPELLWRTTTGGNAKE